MIGQNTATGARPHRRRERATIALAALLGVAVLVTVVAFAPQLVLVPVARVLVQEEPARPADAAVLTPDMARSGFREAVWLWQRGQVSRLLVGNVALVGPPGTGVDQWSDLARRELSALGVPETAFVVVDGRPCTLEEYVAAIRAAAAVHGFRRLILLAPQLQTRRLQGEWTGFMAASGLEVQVVAYELRQVSLDRWWRTRAGVSAVFNGYLGYLYDLVPMGPSVGCRDR